MLQQILLAIPSQILCSTSTSRDKITNINQLNTLQVTQKCTTPDSSVTVDPTTEWFCREIQTKKCHLLVTCTVLQPYKYTVLLFPCFNCKRLLQYLPFKDTLKSQSNGSLYSNTVIGRLWVGELLHLVQRGEAWAGCSPAKSPPRCTKCNSPPINSQCTNFILFNLAL